MSKAINSLSVHPSIARKGGSTADTACWKKIAVQMMVVSCSLAVGSLMIS